VAPDCRLHIGHGGDATIDEVANENARIAWQLDLPGAAASGPLARHDCCARVTFRVAMGTNPPTACARSCVRSLASVAASLSASGGGRTPPGADPAQATKTFLRPGEQVVIEERLF
jgi:hypothetical protein